MLLSDVLAKSFLDIFPLEEDSVVMSLIWNSFLAVLVFPD